MGFRWFTILIGVLVVPNAGAFSPACPKKAYEDLRQISGMIEQASIAQIDDRGALTEKASELGFTGHDVDHIRKSTGYVFCPGTKYNNRGLSSGFILLADDQIYSARHAIIDEQGRPRDPLSECVFQNQDIPIAARRPLNLKDGYEGLKEAVALGLIRMGPLDGGDESDRVVVKMKSAIPGAKAFQIDPSGAKLHDCDDKARCQKIVAISASQERMSTKVPRSEPIAQSCTIRNAYEPGPGRGSVILTNCSATEGASGSINFLQTSEGKYMRDAHGELIPLAIFVGGGTPTEDHLPYSIETGSFTKSLVIDGQASADVIALANGKSGQQTSDAVSTIPSPFKAISF